MTDPPARMDVHTWFGLSYASYFVMPRAVLQAMPVKWQEEFIALVRELNDTLDWAEGRGDDYTVLLRGRDGRFIRDPLRKYRYPPVIKRRKRVSDD